MTRKFTCLVVVVLCLLTTSGSAIEETGFQPVVRYKAIRLPFHPPPPTYYYVPDQMIVKLVPDSEAANSLESSQDIQAKYTSLDALNEKYGVTRFEQEFPGSETRTVQQASSADLSRYYIVKFSEKHQLATVMSAYRANSYVEGVQPIGCHAIHEQIPDDPYFPTDQWNLYDAEDNDVGATDAWDLETGDAAVILGDLDTGLQYNSRDLGGLSPYTNGNVWINWPEYNGTAGVDDDGNGFIDDWVGWDFVDNVTGAWPGEDADTPDNEPTDFNGHGTHVAGIMGAITNNNVMIAGLAGGWNENSTAPANGVKIMALRIGWSAPYGGYEVGYVRMDFAAQAIYYAVEKSVTAINCSWGSSNSGGLGAAVDYAVANGVIVVHAAGNDGWSIADYLGNRTDVLNVAATDSDDIKADFSNYGSWVDLAAPGVDILSTYSYHYNPNYVAWADGTSQAAPHVTAAAGLLKSYDGSLTRQEIIDLIIDYTDNIDALNPSYAGLLGSGRLNVFRSLDAAAPPEVTVLQPNGGEVLYIGQQYDVIWDASDNVGIDSSLVDYSTDSGENWTRIATLASNPGVFTWTVTGPPSTHCRMRVTCFDAAGTFGWDMSDEDFCPPYFSEGGERISGRGFMTAGIDEREVPNATALLQNFPNPFNPSTRIGYSLNRSCHVKLVIYNVIGQEIATLVDEFQEAGYKTVDWNAKGLSSGIYFYRLRAGDHLATRKMILMR